LEQFPIGIIILIVASVLIYLGLAHRVLDRMRLSDRGALAVIGAIIVGSFINVPLPFLPFNTSVNVGGALVPLALVVYLLIRAGSNIERTRAFVGAIATAIVVYIVGSLINAGSTAEPAGRFAVLDAIYLYPLVGGVVAYIFGRSRRGAFVAATLGVLLVDIFHYAWLLNQGAPAGYTVSVGGAGAFDAIVLAGIVAVLLAELVGESLERLSGGPSTEDRPPELVKGLRKPELEAPGLTGEAKDGDIYVLQKDQGKVVELDEQKN